MEKIFNLHFHIGNNDCTLISILPYQKKIPEYTAYYEHNHHCFEIQCVKQGQATYQYEKNTVTIDNTALLLLPPKTYHKLTFSTPDCIQMSLSFQLNKAMKSSNEENTFFYAFQRIHQPILIKQNNLLKETLSQISTLADMHTLDFLSREKLKVISNGFLLHLFETLPMQTQHKTNNKGTTSPSIEYVIDNYFAMHFSAKESKEELASLLHLSHRQLQRLLIRHYGKNYRELQKDIRIRAARGFLTDSDKSIAEISELMGYSSPENFATFIKKETGLTPYQIRRQHS